jgi:hypothetical protein
MPQIVLGLDPRYLQVISRQLFLERAFFFIRTLSDWHYATSVGLLTVELFF